MSCDYVQEERKEAFMFNCFLHYQLAKEKKMSKLPQKFKNIMARYLFSSAIEANPLLGYFISKIYMSCLHKISRWLSSTQS